MEVTEAYRAEGEQTEKISGGGGTVKKKKYLYAAAAQTGVGRGGRLSYLSPVFQGVYTDLVAASTAAAAAAAAAAATAATTTGVIYI